MGKSLSQVVNAGLAGEPEHIVFQVLETLQKIELTDITHVNQGGNPREPQMPEDMYYVLNHMEHRCYIDLEEHGHLTLYLD
jgi:hypothetical protein